VRAVVGASWLAPPGGRATSPSAATSPACTGAPTPRKDCCSGRRWRSACCESSRRPATSCSPAGACAASTAAGWRSDRGAVEGAAEAGAGARRQARALARRQLALARSVTRSRSFDGLSGGAARIHTECSAYSAASTHPRRQQVALPVRSALALPRTNRPSARLSQRTAIVGVARLLRLVRLQPVAGCPLAASPSATSGPAKAGR
jgi:hypothetical protein